MNKTEISRTLNDCKFDPKDDQHSLMVDMPVSYLINRSKEYLNDINYLDRDANIKILRNVIKLSAIALRKI